MPRKCKSKNKGFRQLSMESDPYELDSMNTNFGEGTQQTANALYGNPQGIMAQSAPAPLFNPGNHNYTGSIAGVSVNPLNDQTQPGMPQGTTASGGLMNSDVSYFTPTNELDQANKKENTGPLAGAFVRNDKTFQDKLKRAGGIEDPNNPGQMIYGGEGNQRKFERISKRYQNYKDNQQHRSQKKSQNQSQSGPGGTGVGNFIRDRIVRSQNSKRSGGSGTKVGNALRGIASIFKKKTTP